MPRELVHNYGFGLGAGGDGLAGLSGWWRRFIVPSDCHVTKCYPVGLLQSLC